MVAYQKLLSGALEKIRPSPETVRTVQSASEEFLREIQGMLDNIIEGGRAEVEGSVAKGTYLEDKYDIDMFAFFPSDLPREKMEDTILELGKSWARSRGAKYQISYAEHPYVNVFPEWNGREIEVDVVGAYQIDRTLALRSSVDRTKFHTEYVRRHMTPELRDQVLLTKKFMKGTGVYGSEVRVGGFSGLLSEVLTMGEGSFMGLMKSAAGWSPGHVVDIEGLNPGAGEAFEGAPLIVIDPTDGSRNAGAAVTSSKISTFIIAARSFLESPSERFFFPIERKPLSKGALRRSLKNRGTRIMTVEFSKPDVIDDIIYPQLARMQRSIRVQLEEKGFSLVGPDGALCEENGTILLLIELSIHQLPRIEKRLGPAVEMDQHSRKFLEKHSESHPYIEDDRWCVDARRRFYRAEDLVKYIMRENPQGMLPSHLAKAIGRGWKLKTDDGAIDSAGPVTRLMFTKQFEPVFPWQVE
jgi:tRNA nucleotidyltransferase (CCA-adding enzyme)